MLKQKNNFRNTIPDKRKLSPKDEKGRDGYKPSTKCLKCNTDLETRISPCEYEYYWCYKCGFTQIKD